MTVSLDLRTQKAVETLVDGGRFASAIDVVAEGVRLVQEREAKLAVLRRDIQSAIAEGGEASEEELDRDLDEVAAAFGAGGVTP